MVPRPRLRLPHPRFSSSASPPQRPSYFTLSTLYPFLLLSTVTSLALNLGHSRSSHAAQVGSLEAQRSVLESLVERLRDGAGLGEEEVERELELVGLGRGKGREVERKEEEKVEWGEVFFGKKGKKWEDEKDETDWEKVFRDADAEAKDKAMGKEKVQVVQPVREVVAPVVVATPIPQAAPPKPRSTTAAVYL